MPIEIWLRNLFLNFDSIDWNSVKNTMKKLPTKTYWPESNPNICTENGIDFIWIENDWEYLKLEDCTERAPEMKNFTTQFKI